MRWFKISGVLVALVLVATLGLMVVGSAKADVVSCDDFPGTGTKTDPFIIDGTLESNLEVTYGVCQVSGTVEGNVTVENFSDECASRVLRFTTISVVGGAIEGNIKASGVDCVMVWLKEGAKVEGNVIYNALGNNSFNGGGIGATVDGNILHKAGFLSASGSSSSNYVNGNIICNGGVPKVDPDSSSETDWDGDGDDDGTIGGNYQC